MRYQTISMESLDTLLLALVIVSALLVPSTTGANDTATDAESWDLVVTRGDKIHFLKDDKEIRHSTLGNISALTALAYDSANRTLYMADDSEHPGLLYRGDSVAENLNPEAILNRSDHVRSLEEISSLAFDPVTQTLFWMDAGNARLMKMKVSSDGSHTDNEPEILHDLDGRVPYSIALDVCNRFIYWMTMDSIERSGLDGSDRKAIITDGLTLGPSSWMAIDCCAEKFYFTNTDRNSDSSLIEESNLNGTNRRVFVNNTNQEPISLAVDFTAVYWTDRVTKSLWKVNQDGTAKREIKFDADMNQNDNTMRIMTRYSAADGNCKALVAKEILAAVESFLSDLSQITTIELEQLSAQMKGLSSSKEASD